jgi:hypothetical protein
VRALLRLRGCWIHCRPSVKEAHENRSVNPKRCRRFPNCVFMKTQAKRSDICGAADKSNGSCYLVFKYRKRLSLLLSDGKSNETQKQRGARSCCYDRSLVRSSIASPFLLSKRTCHAHSHLDGDAKHCLNGDPWRAHFASLHLHKNSPKKRLYLVRNEA